MTSSSTGWAIWPSGRSWLVLSTLDGWRTVANATPIAVPTGGGFVLADGGGQIAAAVGVYERLTQSPLLTREDTATQWQPEELPGAVVDDRNAISVSGGQTAAVLAPAGGTVVTGGGDGWQTVTTGATLNPAGGLRLDTVTWASDARGWLTGHGPAGTPLVFQTADAGHSWTPVPLAGTAAVAVLAPCGTAASWLLPVIDSDGTITVERTTDGGESWSAGAAIALPDSAPAWGCQGDHVWMAGLAGRLDHLFASSDAGQTWVDRGAAPATLTDLVPEVGGTGFAVSRKGSVSTLWAVADDGTRFTPRPLPAWVATLGPADTTS